MRYRADLPIVLRGVSFTVPSGTSLAVVGRTGAGKSTILRSLFRIAEACQPPEGTGTGLTGGKARSPACISIDGVDLKTIGLKTLRSRLSIIPQTPALFSGTLRSNLDPLGECADEVLLEALEWVNLREFSFSRNPIEPLSMEVAPEGSNLSVGQRQLVCLARALVRRSKVLLLDEATGDLSGLDLGLARAYSFSLWNSFGRPRDRQTCPKNFESPR